MKQYKKLYKAVIEQKVDEYAFCEDVYTIAFSEKQAQEKIKTQLNSHVLSMRWIRYPSLVATSDWKSSLMGKLVLNDEGC